MNNTESFVFLQNEYVSNYDTLHVFLELIVLLSVFLFSGCTRSDCRILRFFSFSLLMVFYRTKGFNVTAAIPSFMVDIERILVVKFKCCVWTAVCFLCTWMQDTARQPFVSGGSKQAYANSTSMHACSVEV